MDPEPTIYVSIIMLSRIRMWYYRQISSAIVSLSSYITLLIPFLLRYFCVVATCYMIKFYRAQHTTKCTRNDPYEAKAVFLNIQLTYWNKVMKRWKARNRGGGGAWTFQPLDNQRLRKFKVRLRYTKATIIIIISLPLTAYIELVNRRQRGTLRLIHIYTLIFSH